MGPHEQPPQPARAPNRTRDHLANERTFLAWVRTALGLIGLGFVLARMGLFLRQIAQAAALEHPRALRAGQEFLISGLVFLLLGTGFGGGAAWVYHRTRDAIEADCYQPARGPILLLTAIVVVGGLVIVGLVLWRTFGPDAA